MLMRQSLLAWTLTVVLCALAAPLAADAATLYVAANGTNAPGCGTPATPCRTIGRAIQLATDGDRIVVGPGRYGDVNRDRFGDPDEDHVANTAPEAVVYVDKRVTLESSAGAAATIIDGSDGSNEFGSATVFLKVAGIVFGGPGKGFTVRGGLFDGIHARGRDVVIQDNVVVDHEGRGIAVDLNGRVVGNIVRSNGASGDFAVTVGPGAVVTGNVIIQNFAGVAFVGPGVRITDNVIAGHYDVGIQGHPYGDSEIRGNTVTQSGWAGLWFIVDAQDVVVTGNNFYGNGIRMQPNCAVMLQTGGTLVAERNFWGAPTGPGADPADVVCGADSADVSPVATRPFPTRNTAGR
jgi:hypothetical protein